MKSSTALFYLIKSLTKAEKRYFTLNVLAKTEGRNYAKLFKEIESQAKKNEYDENIIKRKFRNENFIRQLTFTKNYLYNVIVKSLISFYSGNSLEAEIYNLILAAKIFFRKSLFDNYFFSLEKAKILAEKSEKFGILIDILKLQMKLIRLKSRKKYKNRNLYKEEEDTIKKIENVSSYSLLLHKFYKITKIPDYARSKILYGEALKIFDDKLLASERNALSITAKDYYYLLLIYKNEILEQRDELFKLALKRYKLYSDNKEVFLNDNENKELTLNYLLLYYAISAGKSNFFQNNFKGFQIKFISRKKEYFDKEEANIYFLSLRLYFYYENNRIKEALEPAEKIFIQMKGTEQMQNKDELLYYYYFYAKLLFEAKDFLKALEVTNTIIKHEYKDVRYDILSYSYLLELFIHYELKNYQLVGSYTRALARKLSMHKEKDLSEKIILKFFSELISEKKLTEEYVLKKYLKKFQTLKKNKYEKVFFSEFPIDKWILKKIS